MRPAPCEPLSGSNPDVDYYKIPYDYVEPRGSIPGGVRMKNVLNAADFQQLADDGFNFARLMIEPISLGFTRAHPSIDTNSHGWSALLETIGEAQGKVHLVLAMFPDAPSMAKYEAEFYRAFPPCDQGHIPTPRAWPGFYAWEYAWNDTLPALFAPPANHPLGLFWQSLVANLKNSLSAAQFDNLAFDLNDEPLGSFMSYDPDLPDNSPQGSTWLDRWANATQNWKMIQLGAAAAIINIDNESTVIVSSYDAFGESYLPEAVYLANNPLKARTYTDCYWDEYLEDANIVYHWHIFNPYRYTHFGPSGHPYVQYSKKRDFDGLSLPGDPAPQWTTQWGPLTGSVQQAFNWVMNWRLENYNVPVLITGFGVKEQAPHTPILHGIIPGNPPPEPALWQDPDMWHKAQWLYDVRTTAESYGIGWCVFDYLGEYRTYKGELSPRWATHYHLRTTYPKVKLSRYDQGLFGSTRPEEPPEE